jgi:hypothetical protein
MLTLQVRNRKETPVLSSNHCFIKEPSCATSWWCRWVSGVDPGFQVRGGGGALKKIAPNRGRRENVWGISYEKSRF